MLAECVFYCHKPKPDTDSLTDCSAKSRCPVLFLSYSSLEAFRVQISCSHENLNSESFEGSAIYEQKGAAKQRRASKMRFMTIECSQSMHSIVLRMARVNYSSVALSFVLIHFKYALMKGSRPPSNTPSAFATSWFVRRSLTSL